MNKLKQGTPRQERNCGYTEYIIRRSISSLFYFRLYRWLHPDSPFYVPKAIRRVEGLLDKESRVFEWGSGASTLWYAKRAAKVVSTEHNEEWYQRGKKALEQKGLKNTDLLFVPPADASIAWETEWPHYTTLGHPPEKPEFYNYIRNIDTFPDGYFDCIAIDGRERVGCLVHALPKLSKTGFIILDDSHRPRYQKFFELLSDWKIEKYDFGLIQTTLFLRK